MIDDIDQHLRAWARDEHARSATVAPTPEHRVANVRATVSANAAPEPPLDELRARRRRRRLILGAGATVVVLAAGGTAAASVFLGSKPVTDHDVARCYRNTKQSLGNDYHGAIIAEVTATGNGQVRAPIAACALAWRYGGIQGYRPDTGKTYPVPPLVGCVLPSGIAGVFPGPPTLCHQLGLPNALPG